MRKPALVLLTAMFVIAASIAITTLHAQGQQATTSKQQEATPIQEGVLTEKQREHRKRHKKYGNGRKLIDLTRSTDDAKIVIGLPRPYMNSNAPPLSLAQFLNNITCAADAVAIAEVRSKASQLTEGEDFVFTDYEMSAVDVIKNNALVDIALSENFTVTRPGGAVKFGGRTITAEVATYEPFTIGKRYLLFLRYIPETGAYEVVNSKGNFLLSKDSVVKLTGEHLMRELETSSASSLIGQVRSVLAAGCSTQQQGGF